MPLFASRARRIHGHRAVCRTLVIVGWLAVSLAGDNFQTIEAAN
jgi:hypothetical protein